MVHHVDAGSVYDAPMARACDSPSGCLSSALVQWHAQSLTQVGPVVSFDDLVVSAMA